MTEEERSTFLEEVYDFQVIGKNERIQLAKKNNEHYPEELAFIGYWVSKGCIKVISKALGFINFKLTVHGIEYVEGNLK